MLTERGWVREGDMPSPTRSADAFCSSKGVGAGGGYALSHTKRGRFL